MTYVERSHPRFNGQKDARRGTKLWAMNTIRGKIFSKLIADLKAIENGFSDDICHLVRKMLFTLLEELKRVEKEDSHGFYGYHLIKKIEEFEKKYADWNDIEGQDEFAARTRFEQLKDLQKYRKRIGYIIRNNQGKFFVLIDDLVVVRFFDQLGELINLHASTFPSLQKAYQDYKTTPIVSTLKLQMFL